MPQPTVYDDGELVAIEVLRLAAREWAAPSTPSITRAVTDHVLRLQEQHGPTAGAPQAVMIALARFGIVALMGPERTAEDLPAFLDEWEQHKLAQHQAEADDNA